MENLSEQDFYKIAEGAALLVLQSVAKNVGYNLNKGDIILFMQKLEVQRRMQSMDNEERKKQNLQMYFLNVE